jgi:ferredoxin
VPYKEGLPAPETDEEVCIGCGACEYVCPARPEKAIYIEGNPVQRKAKKKLDRAIKSIKAQDRDFPF